MFNAGKIMVPSRNIPALKYKIFSADIFRMLQLDSIFKKLLDVLICFYAHSGPWHNTIAFFIIHVRHLMRLSDPGYRPKGRGQGTYLAEYAVGG
ncbi:hypothetical protein ACQFN5_21840 [Klebsiella sp. WOUb02]|uniref:hypothetical protein n=1 Tax=Klebsiella sp. WOUb02 TaxID=3161071 RepID=UPI003CF3F3B3